MFIAVGGFGQSPAERDQRPRQPIGQLGKEERHAEQREKRDRRIAAVFIGLHRPAAADCRQRRDDGESRGHAEEQRQTPAQKRLVGAGEHERQHGQDAGAENCQHAADIRKKKQEHRGVSRPSGGRRLEGQREAVHAIAESGRLGSVVEDVAEMAVASPTSDRRA